MFIKSYFLGELICVLRCRNTTIVERMVGVYGEGVFLKCNKLSSLFPWKRITKLVIGCRLTLFRQLSTQSLFLLSPLSFSMSLSKRPSLLHFQQFCSYTVEVSYILGEEAGTPGSALIPDTLLLSQGIQVHLATGTNRTQES